MPHTVFSYWLLPVIASTMWVATLVSLLIVWGAENEPHYFYEDAHQHIPYISDIAADILKPLFIVGCCFTGIFFFFTLLAERWLRHNGRLINNHKTYEKVLSVIAIIGAGIGTAGLILLSIFDTRRHHRLHDTFLVVFMVGVIISAVATVIEYNRLMRNHFDVKSLKISYWMKLVFIVVEVSASIAFGVCMDKNVNNAAAVLEWAIAFIFTGYLLIFLYDLYPATKTHKGDLAEIELHRARSAIHGTSEYNKYW